MRFRAVRFGATVALVGFLLVFFLPVLPYSRPPSACGSSTFCIGVIPGFSGYQSIGFYLTGWGAVSGGWLTGYEPPAITYDFGSGASTLATGGVLLAAVLPIAIACVWLLAPEIVKLSKVSRIGFGVFGAALFGLADLMLISMLFQAAFYWLLALTGAFFGASGILMVMYATHTWPLGLWEHEDSPALG